jgi:P4 family phage/plasmid primase-like protien
MSSTLNAFLYERKVGKGESNTNNRIPHNGIGGAYFISDIDYPQFLNLYRKEIIETGKHDYLTETQLPSDGPILVDFDFRFPYEMTERQYTKDHIDDAVGAYAEELVKMFQFDETSLYKIYVLEKTAINRVEEKRITKDGLHFIIGISAERKMQIALRSRILTRLEEMWGGEDGLPITNTWEDVLDNGITQGGTGWQLYGSTKPGCEPYQLTHIYTVGYDSSDRQPTIDCRSKSTSHDWAPKWESLLPELSAKCRTHPKFFYRGEFAKELDRIVLPTRRSTVVAGKTPFVADACPFTTAAFEARCKEDLDVILQEFVETNTNKGRHELVDLLWYTMALPVSYYGDGSYTKWIRVGMALKNTDPSTFIIWVAFSAQYPGFNYYNIRGELFDKWNSFGVIHPDSGVGITTRSIMYWCKFDAPAEYRKVQLKCAEATAVRAMGSYEDMDPKAKKLDTKGTTDCDLAAVLHSMYRDDYKCVSITNNIWYKYEEPRWKKIDAGVDLRRAISGPLRALYMKKATEFMALRDAMAEQEENNTKTEKMTKYCDKLLSVCSRLGSTNDKKNIMTEAKELFYDAMFLEKLDSNKKLFCFKNGVVDFEEKRFRRGTPEDYLTKCANIDYVKFDPAIHGPIENEIRDFMRKLFPDEQIHDYMWEHLASTLIGLLPNQTWNIYIGDGQNGKSMLIKAMEYVLGDYKGTMPINLLTDRRGKIGGAMPEIVQLKGLRMAVAQEPQKGDRINDGVVKQLTSGIDTIQGRGLYMAQSEEFYPQFQLVLCTNYLMEIQSNDHGTWRRIRVVPFKSLFTDDPVDNDPEKPYQFKIDRSLEERLSSWKEVLASLLVEIAYVNMGKVKDCEMVMAASNEYRKSQDCIAEFISDRTVADVSGCISKTELSIEFKNWYDATYGRRSAPNIKEVQTYMDKKYKNCSKRKVWLGVRINYDQDARSIMDDDIPTTSGSEL